MEREKTDLVCAYYRTGAIVDIQLDVTRADPSAQAEIASVNPPI